MAMLQAPHTTTPNPDPTLATLDRLRESIQATREILEGVIEGNQREVQATISGMVEAVKLLQIITDRRPEEIAAAVAHLDSLMTERLQTMGQRFATVDEQFRGIASQFSGRDTAVAAALQAQKEAAGEQNKSNTLSIDKSEKGTLELIAQQRVLQTTNYNTVNDKLVAIDSRLTRFEGLGLGTAAAQNNQREDRGLQVATSSHASALLFGIGGVIFGVIAIVWEVARAASGH